MSSYNQVNYYRGKNTNVKVSFRVVLKFLHPIAYCIPNGFGQINLSLKVTDKILWIAEKMVSFNNIFFYFLI